uniref:Uncharacterized protein n=2 Tax=Oryza sativa subsp. japonica TaxID=39947 RepID=Q7EY20_ORYSJ|nr:hypothetical protein [Oryza sativa Japonica Group]
MDSKTHCVYDSGRGRGRGSGQRACTQGGAGGAAPGHLLFFVVGGGGAASDNLLLLLVSERGVDPAIMGLRMPLPATSSSSSSAAATTLPTVGSAQGTAGESPVGLSLKLIAGAARGRAREPPPSVPHRSHRPLPVTRPAEADPPATEVVVAAARRQPRRPHPTARGE